MPPSAPGEALSKVAVFPAKHANDASPSHARDDQSIVFFNNGVIELLYSGEDIKKP
jgi:hypothetical protein